MTRATLIPLTPEQRAQIAANVRRAQEVHEQRYRRPVKATQTAPPNPTTEREPDA